MTELEKLRIEHARLQGEFLGFAEGLMWWNLPPELKIRVKEKIKELLTKEDKETEYFIGL